MSIKVREHQKSAGTLLTPGIIRICPCLGVFSFILVVLCMLIFTTTLSHVIPACLIGYVSRAILRQKVNKQNFMFPRQPRHICLRRDKNFKSIIRQASKLHNGYKVVWKQVPKGLICQVRILYG